MRLIRVALVVVLGLVASCPAISTAQTPPPNCRPIQFAPGQSSATIKGVVHAEEIICYRFDAAAGQLVNLRIAGNNIIISVHDVGDARTSWTFKT
jgi:hypothetical protein